VAASPVTAFNLDHDAQHIAKREILLLVLTPVSGTAPEAPASGIVRTRHSCWLIRVIVTKMKAHDQQQHANDNQ
jgi:hypothetical protein